LFLEYFPFGLSLSTSNHTPLALLEEKISVVVQKDKAGVLQGIQYIDHQTRSVFDGAGLGEKYAAEAMRERLAPENSLKQDLVQEQRLRQGLHL
jgi:hypothetical protein